MSTGPPPAPLGQVRGRAKIVALSVDADDETLKRIVDALSPDLMQLHGRETPERVKRIGEVCALPTMKVIASLRAPISLKPRLTRTPPIIC